MFKINGEVWRVCYVHPLHPALFRTDGSLSIGACDDITKTIYINGQLNANLFKKVLCHEVAHAAMFSYDVSLTLEQEEIIADIIATYGEEIVYITNNIFNKLKGRYYM